MHVTTQPDPLRARQTSAFPSATTTYAECSWLGHCLGAPCLSYNDCDNDWVCLNKICSPCCETLSSSPSSSSSSSSSTATETPSSSPSEKASGSGLSTASAVGIGAGAVVFLILCVAAGFWIWKRRRDRTAQAPYSHNSRSELHGEGSSTSYSDRKRLFAATSSTAELEGSREAVELPAIELAELEGRSEPRFKDDNNETEVVHSDSTQRDYFVRPQQAHSPRVQEYRFEEYTASPDHLSPGGWTFSPVSEEEPTYLSTGPSNSSHPSQALLSQNSSTTMVDRQPSRRSRQLLQRRHGREHETFLMATDDPNEPYTLFRWPSAASRVSRASRDMLR